MTEPIRVLHLEDNERDAEMIRDMLESEGITCEIFRTSERTAFEFALRKGGFDIILSDNNLPGYDGVSALKAVRSVRPFTPVIVISGALGEEEAVKCLKVGATDYLLKDRLERLVPAFKRALEEAGERRLRRAAEKELRDNEERMRLALAATSDGIWDWDLTRGHMVCNAIFTERFGIPESGTSPAQWWYDHMHPDERDAVRASLDAAISSRKEHWSSKHRLKRLDAGWADVSNRVCLAKNATGDITRLVGAVQDITESIAAEAERRHLADHLRQAQKMEAVGTLAGGIAHDFNNLLGIIIANTQLAEMDLAGVPASVDEIRQSLREILVASGRARDLVAQIMMFSRQEGVRRMAMNVEPVVKECVKLIRSAIPAMVTIEQRIEAGCSCILGDPTQVHQVVMNICTNAWHALPEQGGRIEVRVDECNPSRALLESHPDLDSGRYVRISIKDNGHGMDPMVQRRIFEPFFTTKPKGAGTGLGLSVVHGIVKSHGGAITVSSERDKGSLFEVYFPAQSGIEDLGSAVAVSSRRGNGERILIVDDDNSMGSALQRVVKNHGYAVQLFNNPELAWEAFCEAPGSYDLVITDYSMPGISGIDLAERIIRLRHELPMILMTGLADVKEGRRGGVMYFRDILLKPISPEVLCAAVAKSLDPV